MTVASPKSVRERLSDIAVASALFILIGLGFAPLPFTWFAVGIGTVVVLFLVAHLLHPFRTRYREYWIRRTPVIDPNHISRVGPEHDKHKKS